MVPISNLQKYSKQLHRGIKGARRTQKGTLHKETYNGTVRTIPCRIKCEKSVPNGNAKKTLGPRWRFVGKERIR